MVDINALAWAASGRPSLFNPLSFREFLSRERRGEFLHARIDETEDNIKALSNQNTEGRKYYLYIMKFLFGNLNAESFGYKREIEEKVASSFLNWVRIEFDMEAHYYTECLRYLANDRVAKIYLPRVINGHLKGEWPAVRDRRNAQIVERQKDIEHDRPIVEKIERIRQMIRSASADYDPNGSRLSKLGNIYSIERLAGEISYLKLELKNPIPSDPADSAR